MRYFGFFSINLTVTEWRTFRQILRKMFEKIYRNFVQNGNTLRFEARKVKIYILKEIVISKNVLLGD